MKKIAVGIIILAVTVILTDMFNSSIIDRLVLSVRGYNIGYRGSVVYDIQQSLKKLGYYDGNVTGIYDSETAAAVKCFQAANDLKPDGVIKTGTLRSLSMLTEPVANKNPGKGQSAGKDVAVLARAINGEARGEPYIGAVAVGGVIMNRTRSPKFPNTVAGVVYQPGAFTAVTDGQINAKMESQATKAARDALNGWDPSGGALYYFNPAKTTNKWIWSRPLIKVIGKHRFCK